MNLPLAPSGTLEVSAEKKNLLHNRPTTCNIWGRHFAVTKHQQDYSPESSKCNIISVFEHNDQKINAVIQTTKSIL